MDCKKSIKRNKTPLEWISYMGDGNPCHNSLMALREYRKNNPLPEYIIKIDDDLVARRGMLDVMTNVLDKSGPDVGYCYCSFEFVGYLNNSFPARSFSSEHLRHSNYISSCSLMKTDKFLEVGSWVTDDEGFRLLDWALWLKFLNKGYVGEPTDKTSFVAVSTKTSVSARDVNDYNIKRKWVIDNFVDNQG